MLLLSFYYRKMLSFKGWTTDDSIRKENNTNPRHIFCIFFMFIILFFSFGLRNLDYLIIRESRSHSAM